MTRKDSRSLRGCGPWLAAGLLIAYSGCGLDEVQVPELEGPSGLGLSLVLTATPDLITADGFSTSLITATLRDQNGRPVAGRDVFFSIADSTGASADIGELRTSNGPGTGATVRTDAQGIASIIYEAPARTDATANQTVLVQARPVSNDANTALYREVRIELRSAEPRFFAPNPTNTPPKCDFTLQSPGAACSRAGCVIRAGQAVLVQSTASDLDGTIVRYFWDFGNGRRADTPDSSTTYRAQVAPYIITHVVTDNNGAQAACQATITVQ
jgi:hypothetical protein